MLKTIPFKQASSSIIPEVSRNNLFILKSPEEPKVVTEGVIVFDGDFDRLIHGDVELFNDPVLIYSNGKIDGFVASEDREPNKDTPFLRSIYEKPEELKNGYGFCDEGQQVIDKFGLEKSEHTFCLILKPLKVIIEKGKPIPLVLLEEYIGEGTVASGEIMYEFRIIPWMSAVESRMQGR